MFQILRSKVILSTTCLNNWIFVVLTHDVRVLDE